MNWIIHFILANIITISVFRANKALRKEITCFLCFIVHLPLDVCDKLTYHPEFDEAWTDPFYIVWSVILLSLSFYLILISIKFEKNINKKNFYIYGIVFSVIIDLWDWILLRIIAFVTGQSFWDIHHSFGLHRLCEWIDVFKYAPNLPDDKLAIVLEIGLIYILWHKWKELESKFASDFQVKSRSEITTSHEYVRIAIHEQDDKSDLLTIV